MFSLQFDAISSRITRPSLFARVLILFLSCWSRQHLRTSFTRCLTLPPGTLLSNNAACVEGRGDRPASAGGLDGRTAAGGTATVRGVDTRALLCLSPNTSVVLRRSTGEDARQPLPIIWLALLANSSHHLFLGCSCSRTVILELSLL